MSSSVVERTIEGPGHEGLVEGTEVDAHVEAHEDGEQLVQQEDQPRLLPRIQRELREKSGDETLRAKQCDALTVMRLKAVGSRMYTRNITRNTWYCWQRAYCRGVEGTQGEWFSMARSCVTVKFMAMMMQSSRMDLIT